MVAFGFPVKYLLTQFAITFFISAERYVNLALRSALAKHVRHSGVMRGVNKETV